MINQEEVRSAIAAISDRMGIKGSLFLYLEHDRVRIVGDFSLSALAPLLVSYLAKRVE